MTEVIDLKQTVALMAAIKKLTDQIAILNASDSADDAIKLSKLTTEKNRLIRAYNAARKVEEREQAATAEGALTDDLSDAELQAVIDDEIREWLRSNDYRYVHSDATFWLYRPETGSWVPTNRQDLQNHNPRLKGAYFDAFIRILHEDGRWFDRQTLSFTPQPRGTLNRLSWNFLKPAGDDTPHHWFFDILIASLGGGKGENISNLEQVLIAKLNDPSNYLLPTIVISDNGGTGKSLFAERLLPRLFGRELVSPNLSMAEVTGQFTGSITGKAIWFINESAGDRYDHDRLKQILGSRTIKSERKGKDSFQVENTALVFIVGNDLTGAIKLCGTMVDRRFSVYANDRPLADRVADHLRVSPKEATEWIIREGQHIISDEIEAARWLRSIIARHGPITHATEIHGEDFRKLLRVQRDLTTEVIDGFLQSEAFAQAGYVNRALMFEAYVDLASRQRIRAIWSRQRFNRAIEEFAKAEGLSVILRKVKWTTADGEVTTANVLWRDDDRERPSRLEDNQDRFRSINQQGQTLWLIEVEQ